ncbi:JmjC domain-containing protein [Parasphingopyxis marina]|uniref:JmjC domain-containing protein n=1 Tax=Parasphingopyxis marina TaxID=2761622 RepID=A0A842I0K8_9SPHN|nr:cupin domain-containing protein [Parasphingopyxis marina]MBC2778179.1 hypothetical protein [Parasphingopyxis marina]
MTDCQSHSYTLADALLAPTGAETFLADAYARRAMHFAAPDPARFTDYAEVAEIEALMRAPGFFDTLTVALRIIGQDAPAFASRPADVYENLSKGGAVQFVGIERVLPDTHPLASAFQALGALIGAKPQKIAVFLSPPGQAIPVHKDPFEVFTLQIAGRKTWHLFDFHAPMTADEAIDPGQPPRESVTLEPGDMLYVPKGQAHRVDSGEGLAISASLVFAPPSWEKLADYLAETIGDDRDFWQALPPDGIAGDFEAMRGKLKAALDALDPTAFAARIAAERAASLQGLPANHLETALAVDIFDADTLIRLRPGPAPLVSSDGERAFLVSAYDDPISGPIDALAAFRFIAEATSPFRIVDICSVLSPSSKVAIARKLARRGVVQIVSGRDG